MGVQRGLPLCRSFSTLLVYWLDAFGELEMKILVMGAGGVGGYFGGVLSRGGLEVTFVARGKHLETINSRGLRVESGVSGNFTVSPHAVERPDGTWQADLVLFSVKSYHNKRAMETMKPAIGGTTTILTLQNGIGSGDELADFFGREKVLLGAAYINAMRKAPGLVAQVGGTCRIVFGEADGRKSRRALEIRDAFHLAGIKVHLSSDILKELWNKLIFICALSGMPCITRASLAEVLASPETLDLTWKVMYEAAEAGRATGVRLENDVVESTMAGFRRLDHDMVPSMCLDLQAGNPLEVGVLNGAVSRAGKETGVATPVNDFITACLSLADARGRSLLGSAR